MFESFDYFNNEHFIIRDSDHESNSVLLHSIELIKIKFNKLYSSTFSHENFIKTDKQTHLIQRYYLKKQYEVIP